MHVLFGLVLALVASASIASVDIPTGVLGSGVRELLLGTRGTLGNAALLTDDQLNQIVDYVTAGCYTDPELVPVALKKCVGTSASLLRQVVEILESSLIGVYTSSSGPSPELVEQSICFIRGLDLISDDGTLNQLGVDNVIDSMRDSADLRIYVREAVLECASQESGSQLVAVCLQMALLQKCHFAGQ